MNRQDSRVAVHLYDRSGVSLCPGRAPAEPLVEGRDWIGTADAQTGANHALLGRSFLDPSWLGKSDPILLVTDVDSTLIQEEVIDQLAALAGVGAQVAEVTERAMRGEMDFEQSLRQRVALLKGLPLEAFAEVYTGLHIRRGVRELFDWVHGGGGTVAAISGGFTPVVSMLAADLGIDRFLAIDLEDDGTHLTGGVLGEVVTARTKRSFLEDLRVRTGLRTVALGDGANDIPMLMAADLGIAIMAKPAVREAVTNHLYNPPLDAVAGLMGRSLV